MSKYNYCAMIQYNREEELDKSPHLRKETCKRRICTYATFESEGFIPVILTALMKNHRNFGCLYAIFYGVKISGGSSVSQNKLPQLILGYIYILKYLQSNFIGYILFF